MADYLTLLKDWIVDLGDKHEVDPLLLGCIYVACKVSLFTCLGFLVRNIRAKKPITLLILLAGTFFSIPYIYIIIAGRNIPFWVYIFIGCMFCYGGFTIWKKVTEKPKALDIVE
ncbi:phosphate/sulfate permease [Mucilaginibacter sp. UYNi724]